MSVGGLEASVASLRTLEENTAVLESNIVGREHPWAALRPQLLLPPVTVIFSISIASQCRHRQVTVTIVIAIVAIAMRYIITVIIAIGDKIAIIVLIFIVVISIMLDQ